MVLYRQFLHTKQYGASLPLIMICTHAQTAKADQLIANSKVGICWWFNDAVQQFRIRGRAYIILNPKHEIAYKPPRPPFELEDGRSWDEERIRCFEHDIDFKLRGWFARGAPGEVIEGGYESWPGRPFGLHPTVEEAESEEEKHQIRKADLDFAIIVIEPVEIDVAELGMQPVRRRIWSRKEAGGRYHWDSVAVIP